MSTTNRDGETNQTEERRTVRESLNRARTALNRLHRERQQAAVAGTRPEQSAGVREAQVIAHTACMDAFQRLRPYIREHLEEEWEDADLGLGTPGVKALDDYFGEVDSVVKTDRQRHNGTDRSERIRPRLLTAEQLQRTLNVLSDALVELGFGAEVDTGLPHYGFGVVTEEGEMKWEEPM